MMQLDIARIREYFFIKYLPELLPLLVSAYKSCISILSNRDHISTFDRKWFKNMILVKVIINIHYFKHNLMMTNDVKIHKNIKTQSFD
jgi:hypothetical protein